MEHYDFSGYATRNNIRCSDGRTIRKNAFIDNDGVTVPLVWNHRHNEPSNVLGHALLENREDGVFAYGSFNDTAEGQRAKSLVRHGDIKQLSIYANGLKQTPDGSVMHGNIREVSLVLAGANPGAYIQTLDITHSDDPDYDEEYDAEIYTGEDFTLQHSDEKKKPAIEELAEDEAPKKVTKKKVIAEEVDTEKDDDESEDTEETDDEESDQEKLKHSDNKKEETTMDTEKKEKTVQDVLNELTEEQMNVVAYLIGEAVSKKGGDEAKHYDEDGEYLMHTNVFESQNPQDEFLAHAEAFFDEETAGIFKDAKSGMRGGSLRENIIAHAAEYGIENIDYLFPDYKKLENAPDFIQRDQEFVKEFMDRVHKSPFAKIKSIHADITEAEARAKGFTKWITVTEDGTEVVQHNRKLEEVFSLLKRETGPTTVYKKQKLDRDDIIDITDFDVVVWLKAEMRVMLNEELVRAMLVGDGRSAAAADKISESCIRPIWTDDDLYTIKQVVTLTSGMTDNQKAKALITAAIRARKHYKGTGTPLFFTTEDTLTEMLLITDDMGRDIYDTPEKLATKLRVSKIVTAEVLEGLTRSVTPSGSQTAQTRTLVGIIVNPADYNVGTDKGGEVAMFDDFDIDYNQQKYLIETRLSGALTKPYSAIAIETVTAS